ncbi:MAG TPA: phage recombination protein Bet [Methylomirabilota bacterium]|nr:phage recombination protein Bet [Methylomirabilota bacterium]
MEDKKQNKSDLVAGITGQMKEMVAIRDSFQADQLRFVKGLINPDLTDTELYMFLAYAGKAGLNPFNKEVIAVVYSKNDPEKRTVNTITTRDGKRATAYRQGGIESVTTEPIYIKEMTYGTEGKEVKKMQKVQPWEGGKLWGATCTVVRDGKTFTATVPASEYNTGYKIWATKPETMIKKVAESQALSMAVPELLGIYDEAEMPSSDAVALPTVTVSADDDQPATDAQKKTIEKVATAKGLKVSTEGMTQKTAKAWIAGVNQK